MPAAPHPHTTLPNMRHRESGAAALIIEPTTKIVSDTRYVALASK
jgi:hypothetical protein